MLIDRHSSFLRNLTHSVQWRSLRSPVAGDDAVFCMQDYIDLYQHLLANRIIFIGSRITDEVGHHLACVMPALAVNIYVSKC